MFCGCSTCVNDCQPCSQCARAGKWGGKCLRMGILWDCVHRGDSDLWDHRISGKGKKLYFGEDCLNRRSHSGSILGLHADCGHSVPDDVGQR